MGKEALPMNRRIALKAQMWGSIASGAISIGMAATEFVGNRENSTKLTTQDAELSKLNELKGLTPPKPNIVMGDGNPAQRAVPLLLEPRLCWMTITHSYLTKIPVKMPRKSGKQTKMLWKQ